VPVQIGGIEFRYDNLINTVVVAFVFIICTFYLSHQQSLNSKQTRAIIVQNSQFLQDDLKARQKADTIVDTRLNNIETRIDDHIAQMQQQQLLLTALEDSLLEETKNRKSG
jgi:hypothetical protein